MATGLDLNAASSFRQAYQAYATQKQSGAAQSLSGASANDKAWQAAQDFEAVFLNSMFSQMFTGIDGEGPFGGSQALGVWRSFLTDEYAKTFAQNGGIGIAADVYRTLIAHQEVSGAAMPAATEATR
jgi:flagellar protein FlgJ